MAHAVSGVHGGAPVQQEAADGGGALPGGVVEWGVAQGTREFGIKPPLRIPNFPIHLGGFQNFSPAAQFSLGGFQNFTPAAQFGLGGFQNFGGKHA